jgi:hypothetical protein
VLLVPLVGGLTTGSTRPLDSMAFMVNFSDHVECCSLAAGYPGRYAAGANVVQYCSLNIEEMI